MANLRASRLIICFGLLLCLVGANAHAGKNKPGKPDSPGQDKKVLTISLSASSTTVSTHGSLTISWVSKFASICTASGGWSGSRPTSGSELIGGLTGDTTFVLTCSERGKDNKGSVSESVSVTVATEDVVTEPAAPTVNLWASASSVAYEGLATLSWDSTDSSACTASGDWSGSKSTSGSETVDALTSNSTFVLTCSGDGGEAIESVDITVTASVPTVSFTAAPATVSQNELTVLEWNSTDATDCTAYGDWSGSKSATGSEIVYLSTIDGQFTLTCSGVGGSASDTLNVAVVLNSNGTALLSWSPPTENTDGSPLIDLAGYKIRYGTSPGSYSDIITINNPGLTSYLVENLASADWYFIMTSFNAAGTESSYSIEVNKTIN